MLCAIRSMPWEREKEIEKSNLNSCVRLDDDDDNGMDKHDRESINENSKKKIEEQSSWNGRQDKKKVSKNYDATIRTIWSAREAF